MTPRLVDVFRYQADLADPPSRPWALGPWAWATQGHFLVALRAEGIETEPTPENRLKARRYLEETPADLTTVSLPALRAFAGPVVTDVECDTCDGTGYDDFGELIECEHCGQPTRRTCDDCGGDGTMPPPIRLARIAGVPLNLQLLAYALQFVPPDETCEAGTIVSLGASDPQFRHALMLHAPMWRIVVMSVRDAPSTAPEFVMRRQRTDKQAG